ncbi:MAG TPA: hypothetical protein VFI46_07940, partial [Jiangellaceae bacterium]|nr:hypothetical protein [Jiangellaceae bacterium]
MSDIDTNDPTPATESPEPDEIVAASDDAPTGVGDPDVVEAEPDTDEKPAGTTDSESLEEDVA